MSGRAIFHLAGFLTEGECLGSNKLWSTLPDLVQALLASIFMFLRIHFDIVLRKAPCGMVVVERPVTSIKYIYLGICQFWVMGSIELAIVLAYVLRP